MIAFENSQEKEAGGREKQDKKIAAIYQQENIIPGKNDAQKQGDRQHPS